MQFAEKHECVCRMTDDGLVNLGLFDSFDEAYEHAILQASVDLPTECVKAFQINRVYINVPVFTTEKLE